MLAPCKGRILTLQSTPMVVIWLILYSSLTNLSSMLVFPTALSPTITTFTMQSYFSSSLRRMELFKLYHTKAERKGRRFSISYGKTTKISKKNDHSLIYHFLPCLNPRINCMCDRTLKNYKVQTKMYDILDDNTSFKNLSSFPSRSASMQKIPKKQNRPSLFAQPKAAISSSSNFDDLINGFLEKESKIHSQNSDILSRTASKKGKFDSLDLNFDDSAKYKSTVPLSSSNVGNYGRPSTSKSYTQEDSHPLTKHFGRTEQTIFNPSKIEESFVSSRQMKPPIKRRENHSYMTGTNGFNSEIGMPIPQEEPTITNSSNKEDDQFPRHGRSINRRSSIDARSQINLDDSFASKNDKYEGSATGFKIDKVKEQPLEKLSNTESHIIGWNNHDKSTKFSPNFDFKHNKHEASLSTNSPKAESQARQPLNEAEINERIAKSNKSLIADYEKQIDIVKATFQKQIEFLQQSLDQQIQENREMREKFMREAGRMIDQQRSRAKKIHEEEVSRLKDMFEWEKKKVTETLKCQIQSLKSLSDYKRDNFGPQVPSFQQKYEFQNQERRLRSLQSSLNEKAQMLERRQSELNEKIAQLNHQKRTDDQRLRRQERRIMELEMSFKRQMMSEKKEISEEKQRMSAELGAEQLDIIKRRQSNEVMARENQIEREAIERERTQLRKTSFEVMQTYKSNLEELQQERERLSEVELELMKKIRVVQMKSKELSHLPSRNNEEEVFCLTHEEPVKVRINERNRPLSRESNTKSMSNILRTKERFYEVEQVAKGKLNTSTKEHRKLDLGSYMSRMEHFAKSRQ